MRGIVGRRRFNTEEAFALIAFGATPPESNRCGIRPVCQVPRHRSSFHNIALHPRALKIKETNKSDDRDQLKWLRTNLDSVINALSLVPELDFHGALNCKP